MIVAVQQQSSPHSHTESLSRLLSGRRRVTTTATSTLPTWRQGLGPPTPGTAKRCRRRCSRSQRTHYSRPPSSALRPLLRGRFWLGRFSSNAQSKIRLFQFNNRLAILFRTFAGMPAASGRWFVGTHEHARQNGAGSKPLFHQRFKRMPHCNDDQCGARRGTYLTGAMTFPVSGS
jgi:hypothetical protein